MKKIKVTWAEVEKLVNDIANTIKADRLHITTFRNIYGVPRGGLIPAVMLSHQLNLPLTKEILNSTLVVDDISDSGRTMLKLLEGREVMFSTTLFMRTSSKFQPDLCGEFLKDKDWRIFPWEIKKSSKKDNV